MSSLGQAETGDQSRAPRSSAINNPMKKYMGKAQGPDSLRAWIVAIFAVLYVFFGWCAFSSTPVLYVALMKANPHLTRELASWPFTIMACCSFTGSAIYGGLINYIAEQHLLLIGAIFTSAALFVASFFTHDVFVLSLTLGIVHGIGLACTTCIPSAVISQHFIKYRASAMSLFSIAASLTGIIYPPLATWLFELYSLSGLLLILSGICLNQVLSGIVCKAAIWKPALQEMARMTAVNTSTEIVGKTERSKNSQGFCSWLLVNTCITNALANFIMFALVLIVIDFETDNGFESALGASLVVVLSFGWLVASIVVGPIVDQGENYDRYVILSSCLIQFAGLLLMVFLKGEYWWQFIGCFLVGWGQGSRGFLMFVMLSKRYPPSRAVLAFATMNLSCFAPFLLRTPLIGLIRDNLGHYDYLIHIFEAINLLLAIDWLIMSIRK
ncbi:monocarboxylate transporter 2-like [Tropilaelaps mercedesae]|uniref:Monocarboxylate transporter 2-like n=1 Tax=Tropilaelaps mercedesae TaxID=418985 RepID=A0A1V9XVN0_9ACAR|nr:monocarboxylate transporter 2-like [Tropilaelaps mercedesae]